MSGGAPELNDVIGSDFPPVINNQTHLAACGGIWRHPGRVTFKGSNHNSNMRLRSRVAQKSIMGDKRHAIIDGRDATARLEINFNFRNTEEGI